MPLLPNQYKLLLTQASEKMIQPEQREADTIIRLATLSDLSTINKIYNQAIAAGFTAHTKPLNYRQRIEWYKNHENTGSPLFVAVYGSEIAGWLSFSQYRPGRQALRTTAEISYYVNEALHGRGIGSELIQHALRAAGEYKFRVLLAIVLEHNLASIKLLQKFGFERWGFLPGVAYFDNKPCGQYYYGATIKQDSC